MSSGGENRLANDGSIIGRKRKPYRKRVQFPMGTISNSNRQGLLQSNPGDRSRTIVKIRQWSLQTWSQITVNIPPSQLFGYLSQQKEEESEHNFKSTTLIPYDESVLMDLLGLCTKLPFHLVSRHISSNKGIEVGHCNVASSENIPGSDSSTHTPLGENYTYSIVEPEGCHGWWKIKRHAALKELDALLDKIALANLDKNSLTATKREIVDDAAAKKLRAHYLKLSENGFHEFVSLMRLRYEQACDRVVRARKHRINPDHYNPYERIVEAEREENAARQLLTFTEENVNSWTVTDKEDSTIVYSNKGARILPSDGSDIRAGERVELDFPASTPRVDQPGYDEAIKAFDSMQKRTNIVNNDEEDWEAYSRYQIETLGEKCLDGGPLEIHLEGRVWRLLLEIKKNPLDAAITFFEDPSIQNVQDEDFAAVLGAITTRFEEESRILGSAYNEYLNWKQDLGLRRLRREIGENIKKKWYFVLQHLPPIEVNHHKTHCANPYCVYHKDKTMPSGVFRLIFMNKDMAGKEECWFDELLENPATPGRAADGHMWFCVTCVEDIFNGVGLIKSINGAGTASAGHSEELLWHSPNGRIDAEWETRMHLSAGLGSCKHTSASGGESQVDSTDTACDHFATENPIRDSDGPDYPNCAHVTTESGLQRPSVLPFISSLEARYGTPLQPPNRDSWVIAPGLDTFAGHLYSFIKPEVRYTSSGFYTLNPHEYFAFMKWKNMCTRKSMWEIPTNSAFCRQIPGLADCYDFVDFFGDDILDRHEPKPSIVCGNFLEVQTLSVDDISVIESTQLADHFQATGYNDSSDEHGRSGIRSVKPLSEIMALVEKRVRDAWTTLDSQHMQQMSPHIADMAQRVWPPRSFWASYFRRKLRKQKIAAQKEVIKSNYRLINKLSNGFDIQNRDPSVEAFGDAEGFAGEDESEFFRKSDHVMKRGRRASAVPMRIAMLKKRSQR